METRQYLKNALKMSDTLCALKKMYFKKYKKIVHNFTNEKMKRIYIVGG